MPKCERPAGWQAGQGAMSAACSGDAKGSSTCEQHKAVTDDPELARRVLAMPAVLDDDPQIAAAQQRMRARAAAYLARRQLDQRLASNDGHAPRVAARPVARPRERRSASRPVRAGTVCAVLDDGGGGGDGATEDSSRLMPPDGFYSVLTFGRYEGKTIGEVARRHSDYVRWLLDNARLYPRLRRALAASLRFYEEQEAIR